jgi:hypothetical protein
MTQERGGSNARAERRWRALHSHFAVTPEEIADRDGVVSAWPAPLFPATSSRSDDAGARQLAASADPTLADKPPAAPANSDPLEHIY